MLHSMYPILIDFICADTYTWKEKIQRNYAMHKDELQGRITEGKNIRCRDEEKQTYTWFLGTMYAENDPSLIYCSRYETTRSKASSFQKIFQILRSKEFEAEC